MTSLEHRSRSRALTWANNGAGHRQVRARE
jgi:hypothetical protein